MPKITISETVKLVDERKIREWRSAVIVKDWRGGVGVTCGNGYLKNS